MFKIVSGYLSGVLLIAGMTNSPSAISDDGVYSCTEVIGFSQTRQWFRHFDLENWQGRVFGGASIDNWSNPNFEGWTQPIKQPHCDTADVDRVLLTISGEERSVNAWVNVIDDVIMLIHGNYPSLEKIMLQPVVGENQSGVCLRSNTAVRASVNHPIINQAITQLVGGDIVGGATPTVDGCNDFRDQTGHLTASAAEQVGNELEIFYGKDDGSIPVQPASEPWTAYFSTQGSTADWAANVRGVASSLTGVNRLDNPFNDAIVDDRIDDVVTRVAEKVVDEQVNVILPVGGLVSGRSQDGVNAFMDLIEFDDGARFKEIVMRQTRAVAKISNANEAIVWQVGNEINSRHFSETMRTWAGEPLCSAGNTSSGVQGCTNDTFYIGLYAEYFLAPTVEAIDAVSLDLYGEEARIRISLGTLANARNDAAHEWLEELLNYRIDGKFAPMLAGRRVYELVDIVATHYIVSSNGTDKWRDDLSALRDQWIGAGRIKAQWSTEEVGIRAANGGRGGFVGLRTFSRYMNWWLENDYSSEQGRVNYYGWRQGPTETRINDALQVIYDRIGDIPLAIAEVNTNDSGLETYGFITPNDDMVIVVLPDTTSNRSTLTHITLPDLPSAASSIEAHHFSALGAMPLTVSQVSSGGETTITLATVSVDEAAVLLLIEP